LSKEQTSEAVKHRKLQPLLRVARIIIIWLIKQEVCGQLLVLVARKVRLNGLILSKPETDESLDCVTLLFSNGDLVCARRKRCIVFSGRLTQKGKELFGVLRDELSKLGITGAQLG
jgi:hypothetical protein